MPAGLETSTDMTETPEPKGCPGLGRFIQHLLHAGGLVGCDISTSSTTSSTYPSTTTSYSSTTTSGTLGRAGSERKESWRAGARSQAWGAVWGRTAHNGR